MVYGFSDFGCGGSLHIVNCNVRKNEPSSISIDGLIPDLSETNEYALRKEIERISTALSDSKIEPLKGEITLKLIPEITARGCPGGHNAPLDLPLALAASDQVDKTRDRNCVLAMGGLDDCTGKAEVICVYGTYKACKDAMKDGIKYAILPENSPAPAGIKVCFARSLKEAYMAYTELVTNNNDSFFHEIADEGSGEITFSTKVSDKDFELIKTMPLHPMSEEKMNDYKFAMAVAVAGKHNMLVIGDGKPLKALLNILPDLDTREADEVNSIYSNAGFLASDKPPRPFRFPHQSATIEGMFGGGRNCRAGEVTLAHNGVLLLEDAEEFSVSALQLIKIPLQRHSITLSRAGRSYQYPCDLQLFMSAAPCHCGNYGVKDKECLCSKRELTNYWAKVSQAPLDCMEIRFDCRLDLELAEEKITLSKMRGMIKTAWEMQRKRGVFNGRRCFNGRSFTEEMAGWFESKTDCLSLIHI